MAEEDPGDRLPELDRLRPICNAIPGQAASHDNPNGAVVFVTPKIIEYRADIGELLRHELSHAVLKRDRSLLNMGLEQHPCENLP